MDDRLAALTDVDAGLGGLALETLALDIIPGSAFWALLKPLDALYGRWFAREPKGKLAVVEDVIALIL